MLILLVSSGSRFDPLRTLCMKLFTRLSVVLEGPTIMLTFLFSMPSRLLAMSVVILTSMLRARLRLATL